MSRPDSELCGDPHSEGLDDPPALGQLYRGDYPALEAFVLLRLEVIGVTDKHSGAGGALLAERELVDRVVKIGRVGSSACLQEGSAPRGKKARLPEVFLPVLIALTTGLLFARDP